MAEINEIVSRDAIESVLKAAKGMTDLDNAMIKFLQDQEKYKKQAEDVNRTATDNATKTGEYAKILNKAAEDQNKLTATAKALAAQQKQLTDTEAKLMAVNTESNKKLIEKQIELKKANDAIKESITGEKAAREERKRAAAAAKEQARQQQINNKLSKNEAELLKLNTILINEESGSLEKAWAKNKLLEIEKKKLNLATKEGQTRLKEINDAQDENNELIKNSSNILQKQKINIGNYGSAFGDLIEQFKQGDIGVSVLAKGVLKLGKSFMAAIVSNHKSAFSDLIGQFRQGEVSVGGLAKGVLKLGKSFMVAIVSNPILLVTAAIVAAIVALYNAFKSTDSGATELAARFAKLKAKMDVLRQVASGLAKGIVAIFSGDKQKAAEEFGGAMKDIRERLKEAAAAAYEYEKSMDAIEDSENNYISRSAEIKNRIAILEFTAADRTKSTAERKKALEEALALSSEEVETRKRFAQERYQAELKNLAGINGIRAEELEAFITMTDEQQEQASAGVRQARDNNEAKFKNLEELYAAMMDADTKYFEENKRNMSRLSGFEEEQRKEAEERIKAEQAARSELNKTIESSIEINRKALIDIQETERENDLFLDELFEKNFERSEKEEEQAQKIAEAIMKADVTYADIEYRRKVAIINATSKTKEEADQRILELDKENLNRVIAMMEQELSLANITADKKIELEAEIAKIKQDYSDLTTQKEIENDNKAAENKKKIQEASINLAGDVFNFMDSLYGAELSRLEEKNEKGLISEQEFAKQKAEIEIKQAKAKKAQGIFNAGISTAQAIIGMLADPGGVAGTILAVLAGVTGALQIATILAEPLPTMPAFAEGTDNAPEFGLFGEKGRELMQTVGGEMIMANEPTIFSGNKFKGAKIWNNDETEYIMNRTREPQFGQPTRTDDRILRGLNSVEKAIKDKPVFIFDKEKNVVGMVRGSHTERYINRLKLNQ